MEDNEKPKKRTITIEIEEQETGVMVRVVPSYKDSLTVLTDMARGMGSGIGHSTTSLEGIKVISEEMGGVMLKAAIQTYEKEHGKETQMAEALLALIGIKKVELLKTMPADLRETLNKRCKECDKLSCPLCGKGVTDQTGEVTPECSMLH